MSAPFQPPMLRYTIYIGYSKFDVVMDHRIDLAQKMPEWIEVREYHPNVEKYYWSTHLTPMWIRTKRIDFIRFVEYVKAPLGEAFKPKTH